MMKLAEEALGKVDNGRVILRARSLEYIAASTYADDRAMAVYLAVVIALLLGIAALGIFGLAAFNVSTRTKQIGTRRAVGARRTRHPAVLPGRELADHDRGRRARLRAGAGARLLAQHDVRTPAPEALLSRLRAWSVLWIVSLAAALRPARRASMVSPAIATRTV